MNRLTSGIERNGVSEEATGSHQPTGVQTEEKQPGTLLGVIAGASGILDWGKFLFSHDLLQFKTMGLITGRGREEDKVMNKERSGVRR